MKNFIFLISVMTLIFFVFSCGDETPIEPALGMEDTVHFEVEVSMNGETYQFKPFVGNVDEDNYHYFLFGSEYINGASAKYLFLRTAQLSNENEDIVFALVYQPDPYIKSDEFTCEVEKDLVYKLFKTGLHTYCDNNLEDCGDSKNVPFYRIEFYSDENEEFINVAHEDNFFRIDEIQQLTYRGRDYSEFDYIVKGEFRTMMQSENNLYPAIGTFKIAFWLSRRCF